MMLKGEENPPIAWPEDSSVREGEGLWWVVHTKSRNEKALAWDMLRKRIRYFLPMQWKVSRSRGRKVRSLMPLFAGYMFFCGDEEQRLEVLKTNRAANLIPVHDQERLVEELAQIEYALSSGADLLPHKFVREGQVCEVTAGALRGLRGVVIYAADKARLVLQVDILGQATSVEIDSELIEPVDQGSEAKNDD